MAWVDPAARRHRTVLASGPDAPGGIRAGAGRMAAADRVGPGRSGRADDDASPPSSPRPATRSACRSRRCRASRIRWPTSRSPCRADAAWHVGPPGSWTTNRTSGRNWPACGVRVHGRGAPRGRDDGRPRPGRSRGVGGGRGDGVPGAGPRAGRWPAATSGRQRHVASARSSPPARADAALAAV